MSGSSGSRSTLPIAFSRPESARSWSPMRRATSSTPAIWRPPPRIAVLAVILVDARKGVLTQTKRHAFICSLFGIRHLVLAVNKMDLVEFESRLRPKSPPDFREVCRGARSSLRQTIPLSALFGDNITRESARMSWYEGPTLVEELQSADTPTALRPAHSAFRFNGSIAPMRISGASRDGRFRLDRAGRDRAGDGFRPLGPPSRRLSPLTAGSSAAAARRRRYPDIRGRYRHRARRFVAARTIRPNSSTSSRRT